jgi:hypothetical protein
MHLAIRNFPEPQAAVQWGEMADARRPGRHAAAEASGGAFVFFGSVTTMVALWSVQGAGMSRQQGTHYLI